MQHFIWCNHGFYNRLFMCRPRINRFSISKSSNGHPFKTFDSSSMRLDLICWFSKQKCRLTLERLAQHNIPKSIPSPHLALYRIKLNQINIETVKWFPLTQWSVSSLGFECWFSKQASHSTFISLNLTTLQPV